MNPDNFEKQLERLAWRPAPAEWRQEILDAACPRQKNLAAAIDPRPAASGWWRLPFPWLALDAATDPIRIVLPPAGKPSPRPRSDRRRLLRLGCLDEGSEGALRA